MAQTDPTTRRRWPIVIATASIVAGGIGWWTMRERPRQPWPDHAWVGAQIEGADVLRYASESPPRLRLAAPVDSVTLWLERDGERVDLGAQAQQFAGLQVIEATTPPAWPAGPARLIATAPGRAPLSRTIAWGLPTVPADLTADQIARLPLAARATAWRQLAREAMRTDPAASVPLWMKASDAAAAAGQRSETTRYQRAAAHQLLRLDQVARAEALLDAGTAVDALGRSRAAKYRARIAQRRGDARAAERWYAQAVEHALQAADRHAYDKARILRAVAMQYAGRHAEAIAHIEAIAAEPTERADRVRAELDANLAWIRIRAAAQRATPPPSTAVADRLHSARDILLSKGRVADAANLDDNLAMLHLLRGDLEAADAQLQVCHAREQPGTDPYFLDLLEGRVALARAQLARATRAFGRVLARAAAAVGERAEYRWRAHFGLGQVALARGARSQARAHFEVAVAGMARQAAQTPIDRSRAAFFADHRPLVEASVGLALADGRHADAFALIDADRARLTQALDTGLRLQRLPPAERDRFFAARAEQLAASARFDAERRDGELARDQAAWAAERTRRADALRQAFDALYAILDRDAPPDPPAAAVTLAADERIVTAWRQNDRQIVLVKGPDGVSQPPDWRAALPAAGHVWFVDGPDAEALRARAPAGVTTAFVPYAGWLARPVAPIGGVPVVLGDPDGTLPAAGLEVGEVGRALGVSPLTRAQAQPEALFEHLAETPLFHFAGHGVLSARDPFDAHLRLAGRARLELVDVLLARPRIGLAVLSGCDTGARGALGGEHAIGLAQGFLIAGAERVLAANQPVDDHATRAFMRRFYAAGGATDPTRALRVAQPNGGPWRLWGRR